MGMTSGFSLGMVLTVKFLRSILNGAIDAVPSTRPIIRTTAGFTTLSNSSSEKITAGGGRDGDAANTGDTNVNAIKNTARFFLYVFPMYCVLFKLQFFSNHIAATISSHF